MPRRIGRVRVNEIEVGAVGDAAPQRRHLRLREPAPANHGEPPAVFHLHHTAIEQPEALVAAMLRRLLEQQLIAEADPEDRLPLLGQFDDPAAEAAFGKLGKSGRKRPYPRQHHAVGVLKVVAIGGELGLSSNMEQRSLDRAQVPDPVVDDRDHWGPPKNSGERGAGFLG